MIRTLALISPIAWLACTSTPTQEQDAQVTASGPQPEWKVSLGTDVWVNSLAINEDATRILTGSYHPDKSAPHSIAFLDEDGETLWRDSLGQVHGGVYWVDLDRSGKLGIAGGLLEQTPKKQVGFVRIYQTDPVKVLLEVQTKARVNMVRITPDGAWAIAAVGYKINRGDEILLFQRTEGRYVLTSRLPSKTGGIRAVDIADNGLLVAAGTMGGEVLLYDNQQGMLKTRKPWRKGDKTIRFVDLTPSGSWLAVAAGDGHAYLFDPGAFLHKPNFTWEHKVQGDEEAYGVAINEGGTALFVASNSGRKDNTIGYIEAVDSVRVGQKLVPRQKWVFKTKRFPNPMIAFDAKEKILAVADGFPVGTAGNFYVLRASDGELQWSYETPNMNWPVAVSRDGEHVVGGCDDGQVYYFRSDQ